MCIDEPICSCNEHPDVDPEWAPFITFWVVISGLILIATLAVFS